MKVDAYCFNNPSEATDPYESGVWSRSAACPFVDSAEPSIFRIKGWRSSKLGSTDSRDSDATITTSFAGVLSSITRSREFLAIHITNITATTAINSPIFPSDNQSIIPNCSQLVKECLSIEHSFIGKLNHMLNQWTCICSVHPEWRPWNLIVRSERFQTITENFHRERRKRPNGSNRIELECQQWCFTNSVTIKNQVQVEVQAIIKHQHNVLSSCHNQK